MPFTAWSADAPLALETFDLWPLTDHRPLVSGLWSLAFDL